MEQHYGLTPAQLQIVVNTLAQFNTVEQGILFGSRAKGTMHQRSDIDLAITGKDLDRHLLAQIAFAFDDSELPFTVDLKALADIQSPALREHIHRVGKCIYQA